MGKGKKVIIAGGRELTDEKLVEDAIKASGFEIEEVVCGKAPGIDTVGENWAKKNKVKIKPFPAEWDNLELPGATPKSRYNKWKKREEIYNSSAGFYRNGLMAKYAECLIAIPGEGGGTKDMIEKAKAEGLEIYVHQPKKPPTEYKYEF